MKQLTNREFFKTFHDDETCLKHIFECRFGQAYPCLKCNKATKWHRIKAERAYSCQYCGHHLHPTVGTPFESSRTPLQLWFYAIYLFTTTRHGVSAKELQRQLGVTYKTAWRMGHEIREHMADIDEMDDDEPLNGHVEIDETYIGGKSNKRGRPTGKDGKIGVLGMVERNGDVRTEIIYDVKKETILPIVEANVEKGSTISTDQLHAYKSLPKLGYDHGAIKHYAKEWKKGIHCTNSIEGYWRMLKNSISSTHIHVSHKHLNKYLGEFEYRYNSRKSISLMFPQLVSVYPRKDS